MLLLIESLIGIALFTLVVIPMDIKDPLAVIGDYPPAIRKRCEQLGLIEKREKQLSKKDLFKKGAAVILLVLIAAFVMIKVNHATTFLQGFGWTYIICICSKTAGAHTHRCAVTITVVWLRILGEDPFMESPTIACIRVLLAEGLHT